MSVDTPAQTDAARIRELMLTNLHEVFNQRDPERRLRGIAANYTEDVIWTDPEGTIQGHQGLSEGAQKLLDRLPDAELSPAGPVQVSRDLGLLPFTHGVPGQPPAVSSVDVALVRDGKIARLYTLVTTQSQG